MIAVPILHGYVGNGIPLGFRYWQAYRDRCDISFITRKRLPEFIHRKIKSALKKLLHGSVGRAFAPNVDLLRLFDLSLIEVDAVFWH